MSLESCNIIIDSKGNKYCLSYNEAAIYCKTYSTDGLIKETMLINKVHNNFYCTISTNDIIYVLCQAKNKDILLFINDGNSWNMNEIPIAKNTTSLIPMGLYYLKDSIHIIYCSKLPIANYYDVYHLIRKKDKWQKNNVCHLFSKKIHLSYSIATTKNSSINMACTFFDGKQVSLKYYIFDTTSEAWNKKEIVNLQNIDIKVKLLFSDETLYLICYTIEHQMLTLFIFKKDLDFDSPFVLLDINKVKPFNGKELIAPELNNGIFKILYMENNHYCLLNYDIQSKKWLKDSRGFIDETSSMNYVKIIINDPSSEASYKESICNIDKNLETKTIEFDMNNEEEINKDKLIEKNKDNSASYLMEQIDILTEKITHLNDKLNNMETNDYNYNKKILKYEVDEYDDSDDIIKNTLKHSDFKNKFMKSKPTSLKLNNTPLLYKNNTNTYTHAIDFSNYEKNLELKNNIDSIENQNDNVTEQKKENKILKLIGQLLK